MHRIFCTRPTSPGCGSLLDNSEIIVQDDSGIPLGYFGAKRWRFRAFGHYEGPISIFANFYQPRMTQLFQSANPIDFGIGYRWRKNQSNLIVAEKQPVPDGEEQLTSQSQERDGTTAVSTKKAQSAGKRKQLDRSVADLGEFFRSVGRAKMQGGTTFCALNLRKRVDRVGRTVQRRNIRSPLFIRRPLQGDFQLKIVNSS